MTFDPDDPRLTAYALGELEAPERAEVEAWLEQEADARRSVEELRSLARLLGTQLRAEASPGLAAEQKRAIVRELERDRPAGTLPFLGSGRWPGLVRYGVLAAALLLAGAVSLRLFVDRQQAEQREREPAERTVMFGRDAALRAGAAAASAKEAQVKRGQPLPQPGAALGYIAPAGAPAGPEAAPAPEVPGLRSMQAPVALAEEGLVRERFANGAAAPTAPMGELVTPMDADSAMPTKPQAAPDQAHGYFYDKNRSEPAPPHPVDGPSLDARTDLAAKPAPTPDSEPPAPPAPISTDPQRSGGLGGGAYAGAKPAGQAAAPAANEPALSRAAAPAAARRSLGEPVASAGAGGVARGAVSGFDAMYQRSKRGSAERSDSRDQRDSLAEAPSDSPAAGAAPETPVTLGRAPQPAVEAVAASRNRQSAGGARAMGGMDGIAGRGSEPEKLEAKVDAPQALGLNLPQLAQKPGQAADEAEQKAAAAALGQPTAEGVDPLALGKVFRAQPVEKAGEDRKQRQHFEQGQGLANVEKEELAPARAAKPVPENAWVDVTPDTAFSTFAVDVDTGSYSNIRRFLRQETLPPPGDVRIEEMLNYFSWSYPGPTGDAPIAIDTELTRCPWNPDNRLLRIGLKGKAIKFANRQPSNLVFLVDVSGSMDQPNKLPLAKTGLRMLVEQLGENDKISLATYAGREGVALPATSGSNQAEVLSAIDQLAPGGSTNGEAGYKLAYNLAVENFIQGGINRVILCSDGDFNVGATRLEDLTAMAAEKAKTGVFLNVLGFGDGNLKEQTLEQLADKGNGQYAYIDDLLEARKVFVDQIDGTLVTIAKDVKIQVEFRPEHVGKYRLLGYENRRMPDADFRNDAKDGGEIGSGLTVTALYELTPPGPLVFANNVAVQNNGLRSDPNTLAIVQFRYKAPEGSKADEIAHPVPDATVELGAATSDTKFASAVAMFGMILGHSQYKGQATLDAVLELAEANRGPDPGGYRAEFVELVRKAKEISARADGGAK